jgi:two-component system, sensor histidine kinase and response regulator
MTEDRPSDILIVDDKPENLNVLSRMLEMRGYNVRPALNGDLAIRATLKAPPDLILLDVNMPDMNGYEVCSRLKQDERSANIPVIFISALSDTDDKIQAFRVGGVDYVSKPFRVEEVLARVNAQLTLYKQRRQIEQLLEQQRAYYENLNQLKDQLLSTASHDLKNPLSVIMGYLHLLEQDNPGNDPEFLMHCIGQMKHATERMNSLISDLLDLAKIETGLALTFADTNLNEFLQQCLADHSVSAQAKHIDLEVIPTETNTIARVDAARLAQAINNLLSNAIKYTPEGGSVRLAIESNGDNAVIRVSDTGMGIPAESLPRLFEKFYRVPTEAHQSIEGTGLGLAIAKAVVDQHNGQIWAVSEPGKGSTFSLTLPLTSDQRVSAS